MTYREAGVDLEAADRHVRSIESLVTATWGPAVVGGFGGFAAGVELPAGMRRPVLMLSTDGVGTKLELIRHTGRWDGAGFDLVAMCADDLVAAGARPIAFVDYLAVGALDAVRDTALVASVARACEEAGCALVGGETAEHPGVMPADQIDLAGAALGVVERGDEITGSAIAAGDVVVGIGSPNLRSNGFSLVRRVFAGADLDAVPDGFDRTLGAILCEPSVLYGPAVLPLLPDGNVHGMAHVTGGGIPGNLVRILPNGLGAVLERERWPVPPVFDLVAARGRIATAEMERTFNMGLGFLLVVAPAAADEIVSRLSDGGHAAWPVGSIAPGTAGVVLR